MHKPIGWFFGIFIWNQLWLIVKPVFWLFGTHIFNHFWLILVPENLHHSPLQLTTRSVSLNLYIRWFTHPYVCSKTQLLFYQSKDHFSPEQSIASHSPGTVHECMILPIRREYYLHSHQINGRDLPNTPHHTWRQFELHTLRTSH